MVGVSHWYSYLRKWLQIYIYIYMLRRACLLNGKLTSSFWSLAFERAHKQTTMISAKVKPITFKREQSSVDQIIKFCIYLKIEFLFCDFFCTNRCSFFMQSESPGRCLQYIQTSLYFSPLKSRVVCLICKMELEICVSDVSVFMTIKLV